MTKKEFTKKYGEEAWKNKLKKDKEYKRIHIEQIREQNKQYNQQHREEHKQWFRKNKCMFAFCIPEEIEQIENYELAKADNFNGWCIHHRLETHNSDGEKRLVNLTRTELKALDMYYNRPSNELIFLTNSEHAKLHMRRLI